MPDLAGAVCAGADVELFYAYESGYRGELRRKMTAAALAMCGSCPVTDACLSVAMDYEAKPKRNYSRHGIWGGLTGDERRNLARREHRAELVAA